MPLLKWHNLGSETPFQAHRTSRFEAWNEENAMEQEFKQRVMARIEERLDQFFDQLADRMNDMMNPRRRGDRNGRSSECEKSENPFFEGDGSSSDEQQDR
ncbi:hypothetical protein Tco_1097235 [Tanacetum coccineum]